MARAIMMLVEIVFCIKEFFISAALARPHSFMVLVLVLVKAEGGVAVYLWDVVTGATALVWYVGWVAR